MDELLWVNFLTLTYDLVFLYLDAWFLYVMLFNTVLFAKETIPRLTVRLRCPNNVVKSKKILNHCVLNRVLVLREL